MTEIALKYLYEAIRAGTMRAASDKLGIAVSSISRQIAQLEAEYGTALIERGRRAIRLTASGELAIDYYQGQLASREGFFARLADLRGVRTGTVRLAVGEGFLGQAMAALLDEFQQQHPQVRLIVESAATTEIIEQVISDDAHLGLVFQVPAEPKIRLHSSAVQPLMAIVSPKHPLAGAASVDLQTLSQHSLCLAPSAFRIRQLIAAAEARNHLFLDPAMTTTSIGLMRESALSGRFVTVLPPIAVVAERQAGSLVGVPLVGEGLETTMIGLVSRVGRQLEGAPLKMLGLLQRRLRSWTE